MKEWKESGIEWIGKIPDNWDIKRFKDYFLCRMGETILSEDTTDMGIPVYSATQEDKIFGFVKHSSVKLHRGDIVIPARGNSIGYAKIVKYDIATSTQTTIFCKMTQNINTLYVNYCCNAFRNKWFHYDGSAIPQVTVTQINFNKLVVPPMHEQQTIVSYLDIQCTKIDEVIEKRRKQIEALKRLRSSIINRTVTKGLNESIKLKDSGIDWIGNIPVHWEISRLKDIGELYSGLTGKSGDDFRCDDITKTKPYIPFTNVLNNTVVNLNQFNYVIMTDEENQNKVCENDLIFLMSSEDYESIAKCAVVCGNPGEVYLNSFCRGLHLTTDEVFAPFLNYLLLSTTYRDSLRFEARGFTRINIKIDRIASQIIALPPLEEQEAIANYLDEKCAKIDAAIANIDKQIDAMKRLKRALINEVVTGKREV